MRYGAICIGLAGPLSRIVPCHYPKYYSFLRKQIRLLMLRQQKRWSKGTQHPLGTILCTFSCPLDKLAGYLRNLLGKMDPAKHRYPQLSNLSLRLPQLLEKVIQDRFCLLDLMIVSLLWFN